METNRQIVSILSLLLLAPSFVHGYSISAHQSLTKETVAAYETWRGETFDAATTEAIVKGSADEDEGKRPLNHFYDPIHSRGLTQFWHELGLESKSWAQDTEAQANYCSFICFSAAVGRNDKYFSSATDYSWDRAVYEYAHGDKVRGLATLGHILHLIQDSTVPAHVRNDQHLSGLDGDPYEQYTAQIAPPKPAKITIPRHANLSDYFDKVATYTNTHFVSKDTLFTEYDLPSLKNLEIRDGFARDKEYGHKVAFGKKKLNKKTQAFDVEWLLDNEESVVLSSNYTHLSRAAIENGVGIIDLFFRSVEAEQKTLALEKKNTSAAERDTKALASAGFNTVKKLYGSSLTQADIEELSGAQTASAALALAAEESVVVALVEETPVELVLAPAEPAPQKSPTIPAQARLPATTPIVSEVRIPAPVLPTPESIATSVPQVPAQPTFTPFFGVPYQAGYGGSGECVVNCANNSSSSGASSAAAVPEPAPQASTTPPAASTTPAATSTPAAPGIPTVSASACARSLAPSTCVLPTTTTTLSWNEDTHTESYDVYVGGTLVLNVTGTSTSIALAPDATSTIEVVARGAIGMRGTSSPLEIVAVSRALRINEIAWSGTPANPNDQWLELRNAMEYSYNLAGFALVSDTSALYIPLAGMISANDGVFGGYFLIERREQATNVNADLLYAFQSLAQSGEELRLVWSDGVSTTTVDRTPAVSVCSGWCAGKSVHAIGTSANPGLPSVWALESMERAGDDGALAASWQHNDTYNLTARDVSNDSLMGLVYGTPRVPNSKNWPAQGWYCGAVVSGVPTLAVPTDCTLLMRFISPRANKYVGYFIGTVGSSTLVSANSIGGVSQYDIALDGGGMNTGEHAFVAVWENRTNVGGDVQNFQDYFTGAATSGPPHANYAVFEWVKQ